MRALEALLVVREQLLAVRGVDGEDGAIVGSPTRAEEEDSEGEREMERSRRSALGSRPLRAAGTTDADAMRHREGCTAIHLATQDFRHPRVWQAAHRATLAIYRRSAAFPRSELFGLTSQIRRSGSAIGAAIAEACGRISDADANRGYHLALSEACETLLHAIEARDLGFLSEDGYVEIETHLEPTRRMLVRLIERVERDERRSRRRAR